LAEQKPPFQKKPPVVAYANLVRFYILDTFQVVNSELSFFRKEKNDKTELQQHLKRVNIICVPL